MPFKIEVSEMKEALARTARQMAELIETLSRSGRALEPDEERLIRMAMFPAVQELAHELVMMWFVGEPLEGVKDQLARYGA